MSPARFAAIVVAAGASTRMGPDINKLAEPVDGVPMLIHPLDALRDAGAQPIVVVTGHQDDQIRSLLADRELEFEHNADWSEGLAGSIACGARRLLDFSVEGAFVCLGDLPNLRAPQVRAMIGAAGSFTQRSIIVPVHEGRRGHPILFGAGHLAALAALSGTGGARVVLEDNPECIQEVEIGSAAIFEDVDTVEELAAARERHRQR